MTGNELERERRRAGLGQIELAGQLGVSTFELRRWIAEDLDIPNDVADRAKRLPDRPTKKKPGRITTLRRED
jgi:hypothetical protein